MLGKSDTHRPFVWPWSWGRRSAGQCSEKGKRSRCTGGQTAVREHRPGTLMPFWVQSNQARHPIASGFPTAPLSLE